ncbi:MAG: L,D-transpeptidase family protein [Alphaproteobacteria bacterium]|nr:L,D-transpeptidase family protein [Alphaproteobacteria bacterium]
MTKFITHIHARGISLRATRGLLQLGGLSVPCSFGRAGRRHLKREGDGATPIGRWQLRRLFYRSDRMLPPVGPAPARPLRDSHGWCERVGDRNYNRLVQLPYPTAHETMKREDQLYDIVVELSHNERPRVQGHGSAVFFHLRRPDGGPTAGCIAVSLADMRRILARCGPKTRIVV